jgi:D-amino-acid oxidase
MRVTVVGEGVIGLSIAHEFARAGDVTTVVADVRAERSVSAVAAAVWFPYGIALSPDVLTWIERSLVRYERLSSIHEAGVDMREGIIVERELGADRSWTSVLPEFRDAEPSRLPAGAVAGVAAVLPVITGSQYLPWLRERCLELGVVFQNRVVAHINELAGDADLVVVAAGLGSGELLGDTSVYPVRGQVVRLENPGLTDWIIDEEDPAGLTYIVPRRDDVVCGGTAEAGSYTLAADPETERDILKRVTAIVPQLAGQLVLSRGVGLRPARSTVRLEAVDGYRVPTVACYGHGGAGVTMAWGCAEAVVALARGPEISR